MNGENIEVLEKITYLRVSFNEIRNKENITFYITY
jgi:hypothetical protein